MGQASRVSLEETIMSMPDFSAMTKRERVAWVRSHHHDPEAFAAYVSFLGTRPAIVVQAGQIWPPELLKRIEKQLDSPTQNPDH